MKEEQGKEEAIPVKEDKGRPRRSRSREAFKLRRKESAQAGNGRAENGRAGNGTVESGTAENGKAGKRKAAWAAILGLAAAVLLGGYVYKAMGYRDTYFPHTVINGMDVSGKSAEEVKALISSGVKDYILVLKLRGDESEAITGESIGLATLFDGSLEEILRQQNPYGWPRYLLKGPSYDIRTMITYDEGSLDQVLEGLSCFDASRTLLPTDAYLSDYVAGQGYVVVPESQGNTLDKEKVKAQVNQGVSGLTHELDLDALGCYVVPSIDRNNTALAAARDARNRYVNVTVTYTFGSSTEVLDGEEIHRWLAIDQDQVSINPDQAAEYVKGLASRHNTAYTKRAFKTSYGQTVELTGVYGWRINQQEETKALLDILETGDSVTREPVYAQTAASHDGPDYGGTYAEVNLTAQHMIFYKDGEKMVESDFVSGNVSRGHTTPPGIFSITYKQKNAVLKGEGYASPVKFWMPFNGGIGFHDASWRSSFGGSIYKSGGSHGCVNMPYEAARQLFENVYAGMPVICYNLPGTESSKSSQAPGRAPQQTPAPAQTAPAAPAQTQPADPAQTQPADPAQTQPADPAQTQPADPAQTQPADPAQTQPGAPAQTQPADLAQTQPADPAQTQPAGPAGDQTTTQPSQPEVMIQPADQTTAAPRESRPASGTTAGYGPGFQESHP